MACSAPALARNDVDVRARGEELLYRAVSLVLKDEGFSLPSPTAQTARETAEKLLEWCSDVDNKPAWKAF